MKNPLSTHQSWVLTHCLYLFEFDGLDDGGDPLVYQCHNRVALTHFNMITIREYCIEFFHLGYLKDPHVGWNHKDNKGVAMIVTNSKPTIKAMWWYWIHFKSHPYLRTLLELEVKLNNSKYYTDMKY